MNHSTCFSFSLTTHEDFLSKEIAGVFRSILLTIRSHPSAYMKILLFIPVLAIALFASSCRTLTPVDPMTMKPSAHCLPASETTVYGTK